jgi:hypothetical protein
MVQIKAIKALPQYEIWLKYDDNTEGVVSLAHLAGKGIFKEWDSNNLFSRVYIDTETNAIAWNENIDIDALNLYLKIKNITFEQYQQMSCNGENIASDWWDDLTPAQQARLEKSVEESYDPKNWVSHEDVMKKYELYTKL